MDSCRSYDGTILKAKKLLANSPIRLDIAVKMGMDPLAAYMIMLVDQICWCYVTGPYGEKDG